MGLFDSYFDPSTYQGGGGLIDRLLSQIGTQSQYQPSPGFAPNPMDANASIQPQQQNTPIAVGNYQMPRIGDGFQVSSPQENVLPKQTAQEEEAGVLPAQFRGVQQQPQAQPQSSFLQPQHSPGGFGGAMRGIMANAAGGPLGWIGGGIAGAMGMGQGTAQDQQRALLNQQYQALRPVLGDQKAMLAVINPEAGKVMISEALSNKAKFTKIGQDGLGREQYGFVDETTHTVNGKPLSELPQDTGGGGLGDMNLTGKAYLASIPLAQRGTVQGMVEGTMAPPSSFALSKPYWQNMIAAAKNYDPTFDATNWSGRLAGVKDFSAGKSSEMVRSANQTLHHVGQLLDSMDALNNGSYPLINRIGNTAAEATGSGAQGSFRTNAHAVAEELSKVFKGSNLSDAEIKAWESNLNENMSPEQQRAQVGKLRDLLQGSLQALEEKRQNSIGPIAAEKQGPLIKPEGQRVLDRIQGWMNKGTGAAQGSSPAQSRTGVPWSFVQ